MNLTEAEETQLWEAVSTWHNRLEQAFEKVEEAHFNHPRGGGYPWPEEERQPLFMAWANAYWEVFQEAADDAPPSLHSIDALLRAILRSVDGQL